MAETDGGPLPRPDDPDTPDIAATTAAHEGTDDHDLRYQPALDGMRGLGLIAVVAAHLGMFYPQFYSWSSWLPLDQFFVLSGFLITTLLMREFGTNRRISLKRFYLRRIGRLYPMIFAAFMAALALRVFGFGASHVPTWLGVFSIPGYFSNWAIVFSGSWLVLDRFSPLWSLAIEEQFYIVWPVVFVGVLALGGRRRTLITVLGVALAAMLLYRRRLWLGLWDQAAVKLNDPDLTHQTDAWRQLAGDPDLSRRAEDVWNLLYVGSFTRPDGILVGCLLAVILGFRPRLPGKRTRRIVAVAGTIGFIIDVVLFLQVPANGRLPFTFDWGLFAFNLGSAALLLHLLYNPKALLARFYAVRPLVWLGQRSYGIYVIHFVVFVTFFEHHWVAWWQVILAVIVVVGLATVSYRYYEMPLRHRIARHAPDRPASVEAN